MEDSKAMNGTGGLTIKIGISYIILAVVFLGVLRPSIFGGTVGICFRVACLLVGLVFFFFNMRIRKMFNMSLIYVIPVIISCLYNYKYKGLDLSNLINGLQYALCIYEIYTMFQYCDQKKTAKGLTEALCKICGLYCLLSAVTVFIYGKSYQYSNSYFIGSKYMVCYIMMLYVGLKYNLNEQIYKTNKKLDTSYEFEDVRLRVNISSSDDMPIFTMRIIKNTLPKFEDLGVPDIVRRMTLQPQGLILVTGPTGSGKTSS